MQSISNITFFLQDNVTNFPAYAQWQLARHQHTTTPLQNTEEVYWDRFLASVPGALLFPRHFALTKENSRSSLHILCGHFYFMQAGESRYLREQLALAYEQLPHSPETALDVLKRLQLQNTLEMTESLLAHLVSALSDYMENKLPIQDLHKLKPIYEETMSHYMAQEQTSLVHACTFGDAPALRLLLRDMIYAHEQANTLPTFTEINRALNWIHRVEQYNPHPARLIKGSFQYKIGRLYNFHLFNCNGIIDTFRANNPNKNVELPAEIQEQIRLRNTFYRDSWLNISFSLQLLAHDPASFRNAYLLAETTTTDELTTKMVQVDAYLLGSIGSGAITLSDVPAVIQQKCDNAGLKDPSLTCRDELATLTKDLRESGVAEHSQVITLC